MACPGRLYQAVTSAGEVVQIDSALQCPARVRSSCPQAQETRTVPSFGGYSVADIARRSQRHAKRPFPGHGGWPPPGRRSILSCVLARVRKWFDGAGWFVGAAAVLLVIALLAALAGLQSTDSLLWTGQQVTGTEQQGLVYYRWQGQTYSLDVPGTGSSKAVSVYFNPGDPSQAVVDNVFNRVLAGLLVLGPVVGAVILLVIGGTRNYRWQRRKLKRAREFSL